MRLIPDDISGRMRRLLDERVVEAAGQRAETAATTRVPTTVSRCGGRDRMFMVMTTLKRPAFLDPMVAVVGVIVAANLFLVLELSHPYFCAISTSSDPLQEVGWVLDHKS